MKNLVLSNKGDYTLIARVNDKDEVQEYIVAWNFEPDGTWRQGHYFNTLESAMVFMNKDTIVEKVYEAIEDYCIEITSCFQPYEDYEKIITESLGI